jgi:hypothetical protein
LAESNWVPKGTWNLNLCVCYELKPVHTGNRNLCILFMVTLSLLYGLSREESCLLCVFLHLCPAKYTFSWATIHIYCGTVGHMWKNCRLHKKDTVETCPLKEWRCADHTSPSLRFTLQSHPRYASGCIFD